MDDGTQNATSPPERLRPGPKGSSTVVQLPSTVVVPPLETISDAIRGFVKSKLMRMES